MLNTGIYSEGDSIRTDINHVVVLVGYGEDAVTGQKYWLVKNSWAPSYGEWVGGWVGGWVGE